MEKKIQELIKEKGLINKRFVLAVSGGVDSVTLLRLFLKSVNKENIIAAHVNHGLRKESDKEEIFVKELSENAGIRFFSKKLKLSKPSEEEARKKRYSFLTSIVKKTNSDYLVTAHHLNDQAETIILKLVRGAGPVDIWGMKRLEGELFRPLLDFSKEEITAYAQKNRLKWVEDASNKDLTYTRNRIRKNIIPELEKINPSFLLNVKKTVSLGQEAAEIIKSEAKKVKKAVATANKIDLKKFNKIKSDFLKKEVVREMLFEMTGQKKEIYTKNIEGVLSLTAKTGTKRTNIGGYTVVKDYDKISFDPKTKISRNKMDFTEDKALFNGFLLKRSKKLKTSMKNNILLPADIAYNLSIRTWKTGDKIKTAAGTKKLQDVFTDAKIPQAERRVWPIIISGKEIIWVPLLAKKGFKKNNNVILEVVDEREKS